MDYFFKANGLVIIMVIFYYLLLKNDTFFSSIRLYFLLGLVLIISIPLIEIPIYVEQAMSNINYYVIEGASTNIEIAPKTFDWSTFLVTLQALYFLV